MGTNCQIDYSLNQVSSIRVLTGGGRSSRLYPHLDGTSKLTPRGEGTRGQPRTPAPRILVCPSFAHPQSLASSPLRRSEVQRRERSLCARSFLETQRAFAAGPRRKRVREGGIFRARASGSCQLPSASWASVSSSMKTGWSSNSNDKEVRWVSNQDERSRPKCRCQTSGGTRGGEGKGLGQIGVTCPVPYGSQEAEYRVFAESPASKDKLGTEILRRNILTVKY